MIHEEQYELMGIWELAAKHSIAREHHDLPKCRLIEQAVMKMSHSDQITMSRLNYFVPVGDEQPVLNFIDTH